jgi:hypothetical protein
MDVVEMHLAIQQGVDKINSLQADLLLAEEIDIELNKSQIRFVNTKYGRNNKYQEGFEESQKRIDDLRTLVKEYSAPTTFKGQYSDNFWIDQFRLPTDYMYLVNQHSELFIDDCDPIQFVLNNDNPTSYMVIPLSNFHDGTNFVTSMELVADRSNGALGQADMLVAANTFAVNTYPQDIENLKVDILTPANWGVGFEWYWEDYGNIHIPGSFIVIIDTNIYDWFNWDSSIQNAQSGTNLITTAVGRFVGSTGLDDDENTVAYGQYTDDALGSKRVPTGRFPLSAKRTYAFNKFVQQDDIFKLLEDPFNTTKYTAPLTTIRGRWIDVYTSDIFIIDIVKITYIRKPRRISLSLGLSCELPEHCHQEIVDMTVSSILEGISDPRYKSHQLEVSKNE